MQASPPDIPEAARPIGSSLPKETELPFDVAGLLPSGNEFQGLGAGAEIADALPGVGDLTIGAGPSKRFGGQTKTYVFGVEGEGSVFIYVFDRSESMSGFQGRPLAAAKSQLIKSIHSLGPTNQFQIFFYNNRLSVFNPNHPQQPQLIFADDSGKTLAEDFVRKIQASGGTEHMAALRAALNLGPDVIFFLTDAADPALSPDELREPLPGGCSVEAVSPALQRSWGVVPAADLSESSVLALRAPSCWVSWDPSE